MSQFYQGVTSGALPPSVPTSFVTDSGTATPAANILNILTNDTVANNDNGIQDVGAGNTVTVSITNRQTGTVTTTDATPTTALTFALGAVPGVYYILGSIVGYDVTDVAGGAYDYSSGIRTTGAAGIELGSENKDVFEDAAMLTADFSVSVVGNNCIITVTGIAGKTINWNVLLTYRFVS